MRLTAPLLIVVVLIAPTRADDPPKVDLKKGVAYTGRAEAKVVEIRPRVSGSLARVLAKDGAAVRKGEVLAEVDDRLYKNDSQLADARLKLAQARAKRATDDLARVKDSFEKGVASRYEFDFVQHARDAGDADVLVAKAEVERADVLLSFTKLTAPFDGRVGHFRIEPGNLVKADETGLVLIVATDPIAVAFDVDERTLLAVRRAMLDGGKPVVEVGLSDEDGYPRKAALEALPVTIDLATGTARFRATLANPKELILSGMFLRVRLTVQSEK